MKEHPILFTGEMVRVILDGRKTQTRRLVKSINGFGRVTQFGETQTNGYLWTFRDRHGRWQDLRDSSLIERCPYGVPGDKLYVRETWAQAERGDEWDYWRGKPDKRLPVLYRADNPTLGADDEYWRPSIHMPRWASRITLVVESVRVERVQDITEEDARAEGVSERTILTAREAFARLWDTINAKRAPWQSNPWVWVVGFRREL